MISDAIRRYASRPWALVEVSRGEYRARERAEHGPDSALRTAHALWLHMSTVRPGWPTEEDRRVDLAHHVALKRLLDRVGHALARR